MNADVLKSWLKKKKTSGVVANCSFGVLAFVAGLVVLFLTFWFTYAVIYAGWMGVSALSDLAFAKKLNLSHEARLVYSGLFIILLFIQHFWTSPLHWGDYPQRDYVSSPGLQAHAGLAGAFGFMLAYPGASANMIADILLSGPRLVMGSRNLVAQGLRLKRMDEAGCAELLAFLHTRTGAVPYDELKSAGWETWFPQLRCIEGVVFLEKGLSLSSELRIELATANKR